MTLPVAPSAVGNGRRRGSGWHILAVAFLLLMPICVAPDAVHAADDDAFSATVKVDATADSSARAREAARIDGQRRALTAIAERMAGGNNPVKLPKLDDNALTNLVANFEVANERMSAVRYVAEYTFHFRPAETQRILKSAGISPADPNAPPNTGTNAAGPGAAPGPNAPPAGKPIALLPVYQAGSRATLWDEPNPWRMAWAQRASDSAASRLTVPLGDLSDMAAIDADQARSADSKALAAIARQVGGDEVIVALATVRGSSEKPAGLDVTVRRYRQGQLADNRFAQIEANPGESADDLMRRAVTTVAGNIEGGWKKDPGSVDQQGSLTAIVPITGLDDWVRLRDRLASVGTVRKIDLMALSRQEATIEIQYLGSVDQLKASLTPLSLDLVRDEPNWRLARSDAPAGK